MFKKLLDGEIGLTKTFWLYGVLVVIILTIIAKISTDVLNERIGNVALLQHYLRTFNLAKMNSGIIAATVFNISSMLVLVFYSICILIAVWRSSAKYDKSVWLVYIARFSMFLMVFICLSITF